MGLDAVALLIYGLKIDQEDFFRQVNPLNKDKTHSLFIKKDTDWQLKYSYINDQELQEFKQREIEAGNEVKSEIDITTDKNEQINVMREYAFNNELKIIIGGEYSSFYKWVLLYRHGINAGGKGFDYNEVDPKEFNVPEENIKFLEKVAQEFNIDIKSKWYLITYYEY